jgi:choline kinase
MTTESAGAIDNRSVKGIILAAGRGSRMGSLTGSRPKCLVELRGRPLLEWQLQSLRDAGINDIAIVTGYRREMLTGFGLTEFHNTRWSDTNMVSSLECAADWLETSTCIVSYSDIFYEPKAVVDLLGSNSPIAVTYDPGWRTHWEKRFANPLDDAETFRLNPDGTLAEIGAKPKTIEEVQGQYMGLLRFAPAGWRELLRVRNALIPGERDRMHMTGALQRIIDAGNMAIGAVPFRGDWGEIDSECDLSAYS